MDQTMKRIRAERERIEWSRPAMARKLREAAHSPRDVPGLDSLLHNIYRWVPGGEKES
jgi:hypothetical protein